MLVPQTSLRQEASGGVAKCQLFFKVTFKLFQFVCKLISLTTFAASQCHADHS